MIICFVKWFEGILHFFAFKNIDGSVPYSHASPLQLVGPLNCYGCLELHIANGICSQFCCWQEQRKGLFV